MAIDKDKATEPPIELRVDDPTPGSIDGFFGLLLPANLDWQKNYDTIVWHIEFRRKCHNQGFDNLLEVLAKTRATLLEAQEKAANTPAVTPPPAAKE